MWEIDELKLYRGDDYILPNGMHIKSPTLGEICDYGEDKYLTTVSVFTATTIDRCAQLDDIGIDYTQISNFEMFCLFVKILTPESTKIFFGDIDFSHFSLTFRDNKNILINENGVTFDENDYKKTSAYIRKMNGISPPKYTHAANEFAKKQLIIDARNDAEYQRRLQAYKGKHSVYQPYVSALVNHPYFKYNWNTVWDMKVYAFFDSLKRISIIENVNHLYTGLYSGCIEYKKVKNDLDWLKPIT